MATKTEQRLKELLKETIEEHIAKRETELAKITSSIFFWGFVFGYIAACSSIAVIVVGICAGYALAKKEVYAVDRGVQRISSMVDLHNLFRIIQQRTEGLSSGQPLNPLDAAKAVVTASELIEKVQNATVVEEDTPEN